MITRKFIAGIPIYFNPNLGAKQCIPFEDGYMIRSEKDLRDLAADINIMFKKVVTTAIQTVADKIIDKTVTVTDAPTCKQCGTLMQRNGACHVCPTCGSSDGCS